MFLDGIIFKFSNCCDWKQDDVTLKNIDGTVADIALSEKKQRINNGVSVRRNVENSTNLAKVAGFSERAKRAALQPVAESALMRGSMPAISVSKSKPKRPAWDLKGRIQDMEENFQSAQQVNSTLNAQLTAYNQRILALEEANSLLHKDVEIKASQSEVASSQVSNLEKQLREKTEEFKRKMEEKDDELSKLEAKNNELKAKNKELSYEMSSVKSDYENLQNTHQQETSSLKSSITSLICSKSGLQAQLDATQLLVESLKEEIKQLTKMKADKENENERLLKNIANLESKLLAEESARRKLHNVIQELKGNIRVFCRMRPALSEELKNGIQLASITTADNKIIEVNQMGDVGMNDSGKAQKKYEFSFDAVFPPSASQQEIFEEISQLVQSAIDGYNVCIFAYGQTGSGKTYTMEGPENIIDFSAPLDHESHLGMIPRSVKKIFKCIRDLEPRGWKYRVEAFFLEIYNERIQDLLNSDSVSGNAKCEIIKSGGKGNDCLLSNVTTSTVSCAEDVYNLLKKARINRAVAATKCNEYSSRSHYVFQLKIYGENSLTDEKCEGILNLVDLAGSERIKDSGSAGDRLTEAKAINKSLSNLGKVIMSLSKKENHVPYRDSKLTHLLANSLGGNSKTLMFVNISPDNENLNETINSLRFATKVNQCNIGTAQKRVK
ncbi:carboxy-terminal kinesin 2 [Trichonephila inaurata madagascariensis]|uniref:Carboxy-terminal kinesin 2 n=1 Tax=Trichonephila inaurata madagascariensis TaxID=2747483 RepID=A0A8X7C843_9ARAC|nr:carboxy-terminal kinesin 2 [Trichonephila inaurata madagascariensis]